MPDIGGHLSFFGYISSGLVTRSPVPNASLFDLKRPLPLLDIFAGEFFNPLTDLNPDGLSCLSFEEFEASNFGLFCDFLTSAFDVS